MPDRPDPSAYDPRYVSVESVPIEIPDSYDDEEKRTALFKAESTLEIDLNDGEELEEEITGAHQNAVLNLATYYLARGATSPKDVTLGELGDDGDQKEAHADQYKESYDELILKLTSRDGTYYGATGHDADPLSVNSRRDHLRNRDRRRRREARDLDDRESYTDR